jgi:hypothetical protein
MTAIVEVYGSVDDWVAGNVLYSAAEGNAAASYHKIFQQYRVIGDVDVPPNLSWFSIIDHFVERGFVCSIRKFWSMPFMFEIGTRVKVNDRMGYECTGAIVDRIVGPSGVKMYRIDTEVCIFRESYCILDAPRVKVYPARQKIDGKWVYDRVARVWGRRRDNTISYHKFRV